MSRLSEEKLFSHLKEEKLDTFFVLKEVNVRFISEFIGDYNFLLITRSGKKFPTTDPHFTEQALIECLEYETYIWRKPRIAGLTVGDTIGELVRQEGLRQVAFESEAVPYETHLSLQERPKAELVPVSGVLDQLRVTKTPQEITWQCVAYETSCRALDRLSSEICVGVIEKTLAAKLSLYMVEGGADTMSYGNILISSARTSLLHGIPSAKSVEYGDFVLMDSGYQVSGYMSGMTCIVVVGKATEKQHEAYEPEKQMVVDSLAVTKAGAPCKEVYLASFKAIKNTEYFGYHYANIGYGIGLSVHEVSMYMEANTDIFQTGNVRTTESGIYTPGWGGVRIEDQILVMGDGYGNMARFTHDLIEL